MKRLTALVILLAVLAALVLTAAGCRMAAMAKDPSLNHAKAMPVQGDPQYFWKDSFAFGPYQITGKDTSWVSRTSWGAWWGGWGLRHSDSDQDMAFIISGPAGPNWGVRCTTRASQQMLKAVFADHSSQLNWELGGNVTFVCNIVPADGSPRWDLAMSRRMESVVLNGFILGPAQEIQVAGSQALEGSSIPLSDVTGYNYSQGGQAVGALQVINDEVVWLALNQSPAQAQALAAASAALMVYKDITPRD